MTTYVELLKQEMDKPQDMTGYSTGELRRRIEVITEALKGPMSNVERIGLAADRAAYQRALGTR